MTVFENRTVPETNVARNPLFTTFGFSSGTKFHSEHIFQKPQNSRNQSRYHPARSNFRIFIGGQTSLSNHIFFDKPQSSRNESRSGQHFIRVTIFEKPHGSRNESRPQPARSNFRVFLRGKISFAQHVFEDTAKLKKLKPLPARSFPLSDFPSGQNSIRSTSFFEKQQTSRNERRYQPARSHLRVFLLDNI